MYSGLIVNENAEIVDGTDGSVRAEKVNKIAETKSIKFHYTQFIQFTLFKIQLILFLFRFFFFAI